MKFLLSLCDFNSHIRLPIGTKLLGILPEVKRHVGQRGSTSH
jgi:hypothetical protein